MVNVKVLPNGNLRITAGNDTRQWLAQAERAQCGYWGMLADLFEPYFTNGSFEPFDGGAANPFVGLTSAPCIAESMSYLDDGTKELDGRLWWFPDYMLTDPLDELRCTGRTTFALAS